MFEDAEDWLATFERVARYNGWDDERKVNDAYFALEESARAWFENHESATYTWAMFCRDLLITFPNAERRAKAEAALLSRSQRANESVRMYCEGMDRLFKRADPHMAEEKQLRHFMRGSQTGAFAGLARSPPRSVAEFRTEATTM